MFHWAILVLILVIRDTVYGITSDNVKENHTEVPATSWWRKLVIGHLSMKWFSAALDE